MVGDGERSCTCARPRPPAHLLMWSRLTVKDARRELDHFFMSYLTSLILTGEKRSGKQIFCIASLKELVQGATRQDRGCLNSLTGLKGLRENMVSIYHVIWLSQGFSWKPHAFFCLHGRIQLFDRDHNWKAIQQCSWRTLHYTVLF